MKEYDHCSNNEQVVINNMLRSAKNPIEFVSGRLKSRRGNTPRKMDLKLETISVVICACFFLFFFLQNMHKKIIYTLMRNL